MAMVMFRPDVREPLNDFLADTNHHRDLLISPWLDFHFAATTVVEDFNPIPCGRYTLTRIADIHGLDTDGGARTAPG